MENKRNEDFWLILLSAVLAALSAVAEKLFQKNGDASEKEG